MPSFILRDIPEDFWRQFKSKASLEGLSLKDAVYMALRTWMVNTRCDGRIDQGAGLVMAHCYLPKGHEGHHEVAPEVR